MPEPLDADARLRERLSSHRTIRRATLRDPALGHRLRAALPRLGQLVGLMSPGGLWDEHRRSRAAGHHFRVTEAVERYRDVARALKGAERALTARRTASLVFALAGSLHGRACPGSSTSGGFSETWRSSAHARRSSQASRETRPRVAAPPTERDTCSWEASAPPSKRPASEPVGVMASSLPSCPAASSSSTRRRLTLRS